jgi:ABC-type dipeptide/oligopeptide/nickel transport system permease subunit
MIRRASHEKSHGAWRAALILAAAAIVLAVVAGPFLAPYPPDDTDLAAQLQAPSASHLLGTDFYGRDVLSRLLYGGRSTLAIAAVAVSVAAIVGSLAGLLAGSAGSWGGQLWVAGFDLMLAFPSLLLALLVVAVLGPGLPALAAAVGIAGIPAYGRLVRRLTLALGVAEFVEAARATGASRPGILRRHLLPNISRPVLSLATLDFGRAIISVAALGYLGLGAAPPQSEWGLMLYEGRGYITTAPWTSVAPGLAITLTVLVVTLLGDALSE